MTTSARHARALKRLGTLAAVVVTASAAAACQDIEDVWAARQLGIDAQAETYSDRTEWDGTYSDGTYSDGTYSAEPYSAQDEFGAAPESRGSSDPIVTRYGDTVVVESRDASSYARVTQSGGAAADVDVKRYGGATVLRSRSSGGSVTIIQSD